MFVQAQEYALKHKESGNKAAFGIVIANKNEEVLFEGTSLEKCTEQKFRQFKGGIACITKLLPQESYHQRNQVTSEEVRTLDLYNFFWRHEIEVLTDDRGKTIYKLKESEVGIV